jgi:hypothetical protein
VRYVPFFIFFLLTFLPHSSQALELGLGTSSSTEGRLVPALSGSLGVGGDYLLTGTSTGVQTPIYHLSAYTLGIVKRWEAGQFWWARLDVGFGLGLAYSHYGYRDSPTATKDVKTDFTAGPLFQFRWGMLDPVYLGLDVMFGLRSPTVLFALAAQDIILFSVGVSM